MATWHTPTGLELQEVFSPVVTMAFNPGATMLAPAFGSYDAAFAFVAILAVVAVLFWRRFRWGVIILGITGFIVTGFSIPLTVLGAVLAFAAGFVLFG